VVTGGNNAGDSNEVDVTTSVDDEAASYGASWDSSAASTTMTRLGDAEGKTAGADFNGFAPWSEMKLCNVADNGAINAYIGDASFKRDGSNGQVMVKIPKFYYKHTYDEGTKKHEFWVADGPAEGFKLHPAFLRAGVEKPYVLLGAYEAWIDGNGKLASITGKTPTTSKNIVEFRTAAVARGTGWNQMEIQTYSAIQLLYLVEYANTNCQTTLGKGVVDLGWDGTYKAVATGGCDSLDGASGMADGTNGQVSVSYRGMENLWGNVWKFVDGINIKADHRPYVADYGFASDVFDEPYTDAGFNLPSVNGYVSNFACSAGADWLLMPLAAGEAGTGSGAYIPDYYWQATGNRVALVGGGWGDGAFAGLFYWSVDLDSSYAALNVGGRLLLIP
jgi:hypothetical protein